jgi:hypothetical protein
MAIFTINANTNYSAIKDSLSNGDTIRIATNAVRLTVDEAPLLTNITVDSPGVSGRMTVTGAYDMSTWSIIAGTVTLIDGTFPAGATLGSATGGSSNFASGITTNNGTVITCIGGASTNARGIETNNGNVITATGGRTAGGTHGINVNNGIVTTANGSSAIGAMGVLTNNGIVTTANGGGFSNSRGVLTNNGTVITANGGSASTTHGVEANNGTVITANGGNVSIANGIALNNSTCLKANDGVSRAISLSRGDFKLVIGPDFQTTISNPVGDITTIYSIGPLSNLATIPAGVTVIQLGTAGFTGIEGISRSLGT